MSAWKKSKLGNHIELLTGYPFRSKQYTDNASDIRLLRGDNVGQGFIRWANAKKWPTSLTEGLEKYYLQSGDIVIAMDRTWIKAGLKIAPITESDIPCLLVQRVARLRANNDLDSYFLYLLIRSHKFEQYVKGVQTETAVPHISASQIQQYQITLPPLAEQTAIADLLSTWDAAIEKTEKLIAAKEKQLNALYQKLFQPGMPANNNWRSTKVGQFTIPRKERTIPSKEIPLYSLTIEDGVTPKTDRYNRDFLVKDNGSKTYKIVYPGDIVFNPSNLRWGAIARSHVDRKVVISPIYEVLEIKSDKIDSAFLEHALTCPRQIGIFATRTEGTLIERMAVKLDAFLLAEILVPSNRDEQQEVASLLNLAQEEIKLLKNQADACRMQKRGLMQKLLTGQWRVNPHPRHSRESGNPETRAQ